MIARDPRAALTLFRPSLVLDAQPASPTDLAERRLEPIAMQALLEEQVEPMRWLVDELLPAIGLTLVVGPPKTGKTLWALQLAWAVASPGIDEVFGREVATAPVLIIEQEGSRAGFASTARTQSEALPDTSGAVIEVCLFSGVQLDHPEWLRELEKTIRERGARLVILDPLVAMHQADENSASDMRRVLYPLARIAAECECCIVVIHHATKSMGKAPSFERIRGSSALFGAADAVILLGDRDASGRIAVRVRGRYAADQAFTVELDPRTLLLRNTSESDTSSGVAGADLQVLERALMERGSLTVADAVTLIPRSEPTARERLRELVASGRAVVIRDRPLTIGPPSASLLT